jgi:hypothetical protein
MKSSEDIRRYFQKSTLSTNPEKHEAIFEKIQRAQDQSKNTASIQSELDLGSKIMKSPITKLAAAAAVVAVVVLGLFEFLSGDNPSGVVWADVAQKVEASRGVIYRNRATHSVGPADSDYSIVYLSDTKSRNDSYKGEEIIRTSHHDFDTKTFTWIAHGAKKFTQDTMSEEILREQHGAWASPKRWITEFLSRDHRKLGQKTIDGVLCEGLETTDTTFGVSTFEVDSLLARVWVSVETGYPVMLEGEITGGGDEKIHIKGILDQFQWDVELDAGIFEPNIPPDYEQI